MVCLLIESMLADWFNQSASGELSVDLLGMKSVNVDSEDEGKLIDTWHSF